MVAESQKSPLAKQLCTKGPEGATALVMASANKFIAQAMPTLTLLDLVNEHQQLDIDKARVFLEAAFAQSPSVKMAKFTFTREDGDALLGILDKYKDG